MDFTVLFPVFRAKFRNLSMLFIKLLDIIFNPCHAEYFLFTSLLPIFLAFNLQQSNCKHVFTSRVENSVEPEQMASLEAS